MKKLLWLSLFLVLAILLFAEWAVRYVAPYAIVKPTKFHYSATADTAADVQKQRFISFDSTELVAYFHRSNSDRPRAIMILLHGVNGRKEHMLGLADFLAERGIATLLPDSRGHGESAGDFMTYGFREKEDIRVFIDTLKSNYDSIPVGIWGNSMGGAIALQALAHDDRLEFGIIESTFRDLQEIIHDYQTRILGVPLRYYTNTAIRVAGQLAGFEVAAVKPIASAAVIDQPILLAHGTADENIDFRYGEAIFSALRSTEKVFVPVVGSKHHGLMGVSGSNYLEQIDLFLARSLPNR